MREDLSHLFDGKGIDASAYDDVVEFRDPITNYNSLSGYLFNIQMLKQVRHCKHSGADIRAPWHLPHSLISSCASVRRGLTTSRGLRVAQPMM